MNAQPLAPDSRNNISEAVRLLQARDKQWFALRQARTAAKETAKRNE
jgi:hypothetical protein